MRPRSSAIVDRRQPPVGALAADLGGLGEMEGDVVDLALRRRADQLGRDGGIGGDPEGDAATALGEELDGAVAALEVGADAGALDEERRRW